MLFLTKMARQGRNTGHFKDSSDEISGPLVEKFGEKLLRVEAHDTRDFDEFDHIDAPLARLDATDEDVRTLQARRKVALRQTCLLAALDQNVYQGAVTFGAQGLPQCRLRHGARRLEIGAPSITQGSACSHNAIRTR